MALDPNQDLNALFNKTNYSTMFLDTNAAGQIDYTNIVTTGNSSAILKTYKDIASIHLTGSTTNTSYVLNSSGASSPYRIIKFLDQKKLYNIALNTAPLGDNALYKSLIEDYVISKLGNTYNTSGNSSPLTPANISAIITDLKTANLLLKTTDIYDATDTTKGRSLIGLKQLKETNIITASQQTILTELESRNLKFFSAFLVEYWFYSCRYRILLKEFFRVYILDSNGNTFSMLTNSNLTKQSYLNLLAEFLAQLNMRMSDMIRIVNAINSDYSTMITIIKTTLNSGTGTTPGSNAGLTQKFNELQQSYIKSDEYLSEKDFSKEVMEYNSEKNRHSNILLGLYAFLNIAALATVFHLASN